MRQQNQLDSTVADLRSLRRVAAEEVKGLAWPTILLSVTTIGGFILFTSLALAGVVPLWLAATMNTVFYFVAYTPYHEAVHRNFHGRKSQYGWLNDVFGTIFGIMFIYPYAMHKFIHLTHHANTNSPDKDPDRWMRGPTLFHVAARGLTLAWHYHAFTYANRWKEPGAPRFFRRMALEATPTLVALGALIATGYWKIALFVWFAPVIVAVAFLGATFDWVVHHPHHDRSLLGGTRTFLARKGWRRTLLNWMHLYQNYHLIHHIAPGTPFYRHEVVFLKGEAFLRKNGAVVVEL